MQCKFYRVNEERIKNKQMGAKDSDIFAATGRVHTGSYRVLNASGDLEEMINFLPKIMKGKR